MFSCRITSALRPLDNIRFVVRSSIKARRHVSFKNTLQQSPFWELDTRSFTERIATRTSGSHVADMNGRRKGGGRRQFALRYKKERRLGAVTGAATVTHAMTYICASLMVWLMRLCATWARSW